MRRTVLSLVSLPLLALPVSTLAQSVTTSTPVVTLQKDGSQIVQYSTTVLVPAAKVSIPAGPVTSAPAPSSPSTPGGALACSVMSLGKDADWNGFVPVTTPALTQDVSSAPADGQATAALRTEYTAGGVDHLKIDATVPILTVDSSTQSVPFVALTSLAYGGDANTPFPASTSFPFEGGCFLSTNGGCSTDRDHHLLVADRATCTLYETYQQQLNASNNTWSAAAAIAWPMLKPRQLDPGETSADAAGMSVAEALLRYDEASSGTIPHALRITFNNTAKTYYTPPASHSTSKSNTEAAHMGERLRLRADFPENGLSRTNLAIVHALKTYGAFIADNGSNMLITATDDSRWNADDLNVLASITESDLEAVTVGQQLVAPPQ